MHEFYLPVAWTAKCSLYWFFGYLVFFYFDEVLFICLNPFIGSFFAKLMMYLSHSIKVQLLNNSRSTVLEFCVSLTITNP